MEKDRAVATRGRTKKGAGGERGETRQEIWLLGQPPLSDYLDFVRRSVVGGGGMQQAAVVDAWRDANDHYRTLEDAEAGIADDIDLAELPKAMVAAAKALSRSPSFRATFDRVPARFAMVELDKIVVWLKRVTAGHVERLRAALDPRPDKAGLFRFCQPVERRDPPVRIRRLGGQRFAFVSESNDLRFHHCDIFREDQLPGYESFGPIAGVVGLVVGYGSNFLTAIQSDDRVILHNGYHRAVALRAAGYTHAPCIIQTATRRDELDLLAAPAVVDDPAFYLRARRPPLLKDFFDPRIRTVLDVHAVERVVEVSFEVTEIGAYEVGP